MDNTINFEFYDMEYMNGWITAEQLQQVVQVGLLTSTEYEQITGQAYTQS